MIKFLPLRISNNTGTIPARVATDTAYRNAQQHSDEQNARIEHDYSALAGEDLCDERRHRAF